MICILLCAGYATRLYPLTLNFPKPLLDIAGKPMIEHILNKVGEVKGLQDAYVITNAKFFRQFQDWSKGYKGNLRVTVLDDKTSSDADKLGPIGDLAFVLEHAATREDVLIIAGDNLFGFSLRRMQELFERKKAPVVGFYDVKDKSIVANKLGVGLIDVQGRIVDFEEKPAQPKSTFAATCCYMFRAEDLTIVRRLAREKGSKANAGDIIIELMKQTTVYGFTFSEPWFDIGSKEQLEEARRVYGKREKGR